MIFLNLIICVRNLIFSILRQTPVRSHTCLQPHSQNPTHYYSLLYSKFSFDTSHISQKSVSSVSQEISQTLPFVIEFVISR